MTEHPITPFDSRRLVETVPRVDKALTALPPIPEAPISNGIESKVLVQLLDAVLQDATTALVWWDRLGNLDALSLPAVLRRQWDPLTAFERGADLVLRLRPVTAPLNGEVHLHRYLVEHRVAPRSIGRAANLLLVSLQDVVAAREQRQAPPPVQRTRNPRVDLVLKAMQNRARFKQSFGE